MRSSVRKREQWYVGVRGRIPYVYSSLQEKPPFKLDCVLGPYGSASDAWNKGEEVLRQSNAPWRNQAEKEVRWYVGFPKKGSPESFTTARQVTKRAFPEYNYVVGPFNDKRAVEKYATSLARPLKSNPKPTRESKVVYDKVLAIEARKGRKSNWPGENFRHDFKHGGKIVGLPSGDLLIKRGKSKRKLWKKFDYD